MGALTNTSIKDRYKSLLKLTGTANDVLAADASAKYVEDGAGNASTLSLSTNRVGIGTASPSTLLNLAQDAADTKLAIEVHGTSSSCHLDLIRTRATEADPDKVADNDYLGLIRFYGLGADAGTTSIGAGIYAVVDGTVDTALRVPTELLFVTAAGASDNDVATKMVIKPNGNVGIGTPIPGYDLHIKGGQSGDSASGGGQLAIEGTDVALVAGDDLGTIYFLGADSTGYTPPTLGAIITAEAATDWDYTSSSANDAPTKLKFYTQDSTTSNTCATDSVSPRMTIDHAGNVGIGTAAPEVTLSIEGSGSTSYATTLSSGRNVGSDLLWLKNAHASAGFAGLYFSVDNTTNPEGRIALTNEGSKDGDFTFALRSADNVVERMRIDSSGNVGIGTASPGSILEIHDTLPTLKFEDDTARASSPLLSMDFTYIYSDAGAKATATFLNHGKENTTEGNYASYMQFLTQTATDGTTNVAIHIDSSQNVGIGTTSPNAALHVADASQTDGNFRYNTTIRNDTVVFGSNPRTGINFEVQDTADTFFGAAGIMAGKTNTTQHQEGGTLSFWTRVDPTTDATAGTMTERMTILDSGNVGIGTPIPLTKLHVTGINGATAVYVQNTESHLIASDTILHLDFTNNDGNPDEDGYFIYCDDKYETKFLVFSHGDVESRTNSYTTISDGRLKENVVDYNDGLALINSLKPRKFNWKNGINRDTSETQYGFIAQEIEEVSDESMNLYYKRSLEESASENKYIDDGIKYTSQLGLKDAQYVSAIQELSTMVQELSAKVIALENA